VGPELSWQDETAGRTFAPWVNIALIVGVIAYAALEAAFGGGFELAEGSVSTQVRDLLWFSVICGLASFATLEALKRIAGLRGIFNRRQLATWLDERTPDERGPDALRREERTLDESPNPAFDNLMEAMGLGDRSVPDGDEKPPPLSVNRGDYRRVFNLPIERLAAQISSAVDVALVSPDRYRSLIGALVGGEAGRKISSSRSVLEFFKQESEGTDDDSRFELAQRVRAGLDQLQISLGEKWRLYVQGAALWIAGLYGIGLSHADDSSSESRYVLSALVLGGIFAWLARDLAAAVERARR
jgi:hypothetical protein